MIVFRYDRTFEGLLTVVFDAYSRKSFPERLIGPGRAGPDVRPGGARLDDRSGPGGAGMEGVAEEAAPASS